MSAGRPEELTARRAVTHTGFRVLRDPAVGPGHELSSGSSGQGELRD